MLPALCLLISLVVSMLDIPQVLHMGQGGKLGS